MEKVHFEMLAAGSWPTSLHYDIWDELERVAMDSHISRHSVSTAMFSVRDAMRWAVQTEVIRRDCAEIAVLIEPLSAEIDTLTDCPEVLVQSAWRWSRSGSSRSDRRPPGRSPSAS